MKKMLLLAAAAIMALGISAEETSKTAQQSTQTQTTTNNAQKNMQGRPDCFKFRRDNGKKVPEQEKKKPAEGVKIEKLKKTATEK